MKELIEKLKREGKLREQKVAWVQIEGLLKDALRDIREAKAVLTVGERSPFLMAYQSMLKAGRSLLFLEGLRPADGSQHRTVILVCETLLGSRFKALAEQFETMRRKRNQLTYEYGGLVTHDETKNALTDAEEWIHAVLEKAKAVNPQFELPLQ
ncbi:MAG: HEPN domain-containing protein [Candidatus Omnitrophica bacterium]|nr:HEPN domain-containing protein [Candidatus Omnitrophota bacterium]